MLKKILGGLLLLYVALHFYRPNYNQREITAEEDFLHHYGAPDEVAVIFKKSCYDCHSDNTQYHWYDHVVPIGWWIDNNIKRGKFSLNFSRWTRYDGLTQLSALSAIEYDINTDQMPTELYQKVHPETRLTEDEKKRAVDWILNIDRMKIDAHSH